MKKKKNTLLWKITGDNLPGDSYLFGTMHVKDKKAFVFQQQVYEMIDRCDAFATEFNLEEMQSGAQENTMDLPEGITLDQLLSPKQYRKLEKLFAKTIGIDLVHFNNSLPILISNLLTERIMASEMSVSIDQDLWNYARRQEKIALGVETYQEQIDILKKISIDYQVKSLNSMVKNFKRHTKQIKKLTKLYQAADIQQLFKSSKKGLGGLRKILLYDRNILMAERIARMAQEQTICVAIGAGHLAGKKGVLRLLKKEGLRAWPVDVRKMVSEVEDATK